MSSLGGDASLPGRFDLIGTLGRGGMGVVYEVFDRERDTVLALKSIRHIRGASTGNSDAADALLRFKDEFRGVRDIKHPNLVELGELIEADGQWYYTMELVGGESFIRYVRGDHQVPTADDVGTRSLGPVGDSTETLATRPSASGGHGGVVGATPCVHRLQAPPVDLSRLRAAMAQLATGIAALHRAGKLHCDIKPSNVLVDGTGRVVVLDFGLSIASGQDYDALRAGGTAPYMAPEQSDTAPLTPAADWYAVGVMLFEALTAHVPFDDANHGDLLARKRAMAAPPVSAYVDGAPADLADLADRLLARDPAHRPDEAEVLRILHAQSPDAWAADAPGASGASAAFVGRERELTAMHAALEDAIAGACVAVFVEGASGVGKSATVDAFVAQLANVRPDAVVLRGRCHEKEAVPYKAFDGVIDRLTDFLARCTDEQRAHILGEQLSLVAPLFPALRAIERAAASEPATSPDEVAPADRRHRGFEALRDVLSRIARERPLVCVIDDVQWTDEESLVLLAELCREPRAVPMLLLASARQDPGTPACAAAAVAGADVRRMSLGGLTDADARRLIDAVAADANTPLNTEDILAETAGHPMFIEELVRHARDARAGSSLDDALRARAERLPEDARALLDAVVLVGVPIAQSVAAGAAHLPPERVGHAVAVLRAARMIRIHGARPRDPVEPFHDRVREAVYGALAPAHRSALHARVADELETAHERAELIAHHLLAAGQAQRCARLYETAARDALASLAFERAAALFRAALDTGTYAHDERRSLLTAYGDALSHAGRPGDAARAFAEAETHGSAPEAERLELLRRAAEHYLSGGYLEPGLDATRRLLRPFGASLPRTRVGAIASLLLRQVQLDRHALTWKARNEHELDDQTRAKMDTFWSVGSGLGLVDSVSGALFITRGALLCLAAGDRMRIARALSAVSFAHAGLGRQRHATRLIDACGRAADAQDDPLARFYHAFARAGFAFVADNDWHACLHHAREGTELWKRAGRRGGSEADVIEQLAFWSTDNLGRMREIRERVPARIRAAQRAGNRFIEVSFRAFFSNVYLSQDRPRDARRDTQDAIDSWLPGNTRFGNQDYLALRSLTQIALYAGDGEAHAEALEARWRAFFRSVMSRALLLRVDGLGRSGSFALMRALEARNRGDHSAARTLARRARRAAHALAKEPIPWALDDHLHLGSALAAYDGDELEQVRLLRAALQRAADRDMALNLACIQHRLAGVVGGTEGDQLRAASEAWATSEGVVNLPRYAAALLPG